MAGTVTIALDISQVPSGNVRSSTSQAPNSSNDYAAVPVVLQNGNNAVAVPAWAVGVIIRPPANNAVALTLKGPTAGDAGLRIAPNLVTGPIFFDPAALPATININAANVTVGATIVEFV